MAANKVDIDTENSTYIQIQFMVRSKVDKFLKLIGRYDEIGSFDKMVIGYLLAFV